MWHVCKGLSVWVKPAVQHWCITRGPFPHTAIAELNFIQALE